MEIILRVDISKLGKAYAIVNVKDGFARNYLLPKGLAFKVTKSNLEQIENDKKLKKLGEEKEKRNYRDLCESLSDKSFTIPVTTHDEEKLYGSVSKEDVLDAIKLEGIDIQGDNIQFVQPIKELGIYEVEVRFKYDIKTKIKIWVVKK